MIRVGLTGGLGCGKSFVADHLEQLGCYVLQADEIGHAVLARGGEAYYPVIEKFGPGVLSKDGTIDRRKLAAEVFSDPERLHLLNSLVHPAVFQREADFVTAIGALDPNAIVVVEAAILIETGSYRSYDRVIVVVCAEEQQIERAMLRGSLLREEAEARLRRQMPVLEKRKYADYVIDTSGSKEQTLEQTRTVYETLRSIGK